MPDLCSSSLQTFELHTISSDAECYDKKKRNHRSLVLFVPFYATNIVIFPERAKKKHRNRRGLPALSRKISRFEPACFLNCNIGMANHFASDDPSSIIKISLLLKAKILIYYGTRKDRLTAILLPIFHQGKTLSCLSASFSLSKGTMGNLSAG